MEGVEISPLLRHRCMVLPSLWDHHQDCMWEGATAQIEKLEHFIKGSGITALRINNWEYSADLSWDEIAGKERLPSAHPIPIALHGIDLAIVSNKAIRMCEWP